MEWKEYGYTKWNVIYSKITSKFLPLTLLPEYCDTDNEPQALSNCGAFLKQNTKIMYRSPH